MGQPLVSDELWAEVEPLLPPHAASPKGGRPRVPDRATLTGILFVLKSGIPWEMLPAEMGCGSGMTCWRRLKEWHEAGVWQRLHAVLLEKLENAGAVDWERAAIDSSSVRAVGGGEATGPSPVDRRKPGSKHHLMVDAKSGAPLATTLTGANRHDVTQALPLVRSLPDHEEEPFRLPEELYADRAYDSEPLREDLREIGIEPHLAKRRTAHGSGLGVFRWPVERTIAWLHWFRRLRVRFERRADIHEGFLALTKSLVCFNILQHAATNSS